MTQPTSIAAARGSFNDPGDGPYAASPIAPLLFAPSQWGSLPPAWGTDIYGRDTWLQRFLTEEPYMGSAVASISARNAAYSWTLSGPTEPVKATANMLNNASYGKGWTRFGSEFTYNLLSQDNGAFIETIRSGPTPADPLVGLAVLPSQACFGTGDPEYPVVFRDIKGQMHRLGWWQAVHVLEMPVYHRTYPAIQVCAVSRALKQAQIWYGVQTYVEEKANGRFARAAHIISGITRRELDTAIQLAQTLASQQGLSRYQPPVLIPSLQDRAPVIATLELASLPEGFDLDVFHRQYLTVLAMAFLCEYQEFAPLPSNNIGTGTQSDTLDQKAKLKGAALWRKSMAQTINAIIPNDVIFTFDEEDVDEEKRQADVRELRARARKQDIEAGILDGQAGREIMLRDGELNEKQYAELCLRMGGESTTADTGTMSNEEGSMYQKALLTETVEEDRASAEADAARIQQRFLTRMFRTLRGRMENEV